MVRVVSTFCVALMGLTILTLYHISEQTRVARQDLAVTERHIAEERTQISVLETQWQNVAGPATVQKLAQATLGMSDATTLQLSSFKDLPRRADDAFEGVRAAAAQQPVVTGPILKISVRSGM